MRAEQLFESDGERTARLLREKQTETKVRRWAEVLQKQLSSEAGREFVSVLLEQFCGLTAGSFVEHDAAGTAYNEGKRAVGLNLLADIQSAAPVGYVEMMKERLKRFDEARLAEAQERAQKK